MSTLHKRAMEAVLAAAEQDIAEALRENGIRDRHGEAADDTVLDVAILHAYRIFVRICERDGLEADARLFVELASELAEEIEREDAGE
ncbi:hypothetical protein [Arenibaculum pallidiluteum]|uniref:hypothetical protein n=1 Tax=Arenibaculum pallidiluteum TaxID=2812559 RepID=UPI001A959996|nr:hypothetical protein [Arenibaculum pallidiluteum]